MTLQALRLSNVRSYDEAGFDFIPGATIVIGPNASGKTNLLEAVYVLHRGGSWRGSVLGMCRFGEETMRVEGHFEAMSRAVAVSVEQRPPERRFTINATSASRWSYQQRLPVVLFEPDDVRLVGGSPQRRRDYLDGLVEQLLSTGQIIRRRFERALRQRNTLLKQIVDGHSGLDVLYAWDIQYAHAASELSTARRMVMEALAPVIPDLYRELSGDTSLLDVRYPYPEQSTADASRIMNALQHNQSLDIQRGSTSIGPHREDMGIILRGHAAETLASRGEVRTIILALKLAELELLRDKHTISPILLLDDVFSELDGKRRRLLTNYVQKQQTIITTTDADVVEKEFSGSAQLLAL